MPSHLSIKTKISVTFILLGLAVLCIIAGLTYGYSHAELKKSISTQQTTLVNSLAAQLDDRLFLIHEQLKHLAATIDVTALGDLRAVQKRFRDEEDQRVFFDDGLLLVNPAGKIMAEYPQRPERIGTTIPADREYFQEGLAGGKPYVSSPYRSSASGEPVIAFTVPIRNKDGSMAALLVGRHRLWSGKFLSDLAELRIGKTGYLYIVDKHRHIIVHPDRSRVYERIRPGANAGLERALNGFEGTMENVNSRGVAGLSSFKHLSAAPWILGTHYPISEAYQPIGTAVRYFLLIVLGAGIASVLVVRYVVQRMTRPLAMLTEHVGTISTKHGEDRLVSTDSRDEIGTLANVFNAMITELDDRQRRLDEEMAFAESLVTNSAAPIFVLGKDHRVIYWNRALEKLTGIKGDDMKGNSRQWEPFYGDQRPTLADIVLDSAEGVLPKFYENYRPSRFIEGAFQAEGWYRFTATGRHYLFFHASPIRNNAGEVIGAVETLEDLTDTKQIEEMLNDQYRFLQEIIDAITNPVYYKDRLGRYIGCNHAFEAFLGHAKKDILGKTIGDLISGDYAAEHERMNLECMRQAAQQTYESVLVRAGGDIRNVIATKAPYYNKKGKVAGLVGTFTDITERHAMEEQVRRLSQAVEQSPVSIVITDTAGTIEYVNPMFCKVTGYSREESIGRNPHILKSGTMADESYAELWRTIAAGGEWRGEFRNRRNNGELFWEQSSISPLTDKNGRITHYLALKEDITARKLAEQALEESKKELEAKHAELELLFSLVEAAKQEWEQTLDCLRDLVIMIYPDGKIRRCNHLLRELANRPHDEIVGADWREMLTEAGFSFTAFDGENGELVHESSQRLYNLRIYDITAPDSGLVTRRVVSINDTTALRSMTAELQKAYDELRTTQMKVFQQEKLASIGQLAAGVAHEINNPMGFISSNLTTLGKYHERISEFIAILFAALSGAAGGADSAGVDEQRKRLKIDYILEDTPQLIAESQDGAQRVRKIVQDLKSFSRVDESEHKRVDLNECLDSTINIAWNEIKYVASLDREYGDIPPVQCYPQQLNQVFMNLLVNAAHAIEGQGTIRVRTWQEGDMICVAVSDTGCGIPAENLKRIFEPFFTTKDVGKGTGLGLSISYDIVKKHNGEMLVESEVGKGTTFTVRLPASGIEG